MKYVFGVLAVLAVIILALVLVFNRGDDNPARTTEAPKGLIDYADQNSTVSHTTYGPLVGDDERRAVRITVSPSERRIEILSGYNESVIGSHSFENNATAYENFLSALNLAGFTNTQKTSIADERGVCPTGNRFAYNLSDNGDNVANLWSTSCGKNGTFAGNATNVRSLFREQIPDYNLLVRGVEL